MTRRLIETWLPIAALGEESCARASLDDRAAADLLPACMVGAPTARRVARRDPRIVAAGRC